MEDVATETNLNKNMKKAQLGIGGMTCASCVNVVEKTLVNKGKASKASVNLIGEKAVIEYDPNKTTIEDMIKAVEVVGYSAESLEEKGYIKGRFGAIEMWKSYLHYAEGHSQETERIRQAREHLNRLLVRVQK